MNNIAHSIQAVPTTAKPSPVFNGTHCVAIRIWHWASFLAISGSITMVILASTILSTGDNINLVHDQLQQKGMVTTRDQAVSVAHAFNDRLWDLHKWFGFVLCGLVVARMVIELTQSPDEKLGSQLKRALGIKPADREGQLQQRHYCTVKSIYLVFYAALLVMAITGIGLALEDVPFFGSIRSGIKSIHSFFQWVIYAFIVMHLAGVILADLGKYKGLVSAMIHGKSIKR